MPKPLSAKYLNLLGKPKIPEGPELKEKAIVQIPRELSDKLGEELLERTKDRLRAEYEKTGTHNTEHIALIENTLKDGKESLSVVGNEDPNNKLTEKQAIALEAIVIATGTRPSIKISDIENNVDIDFGEWKTPFSDFRDKYLNLSKSVGRIDLAGNHSGTGFVVGPNLIMTNRHVLLNLAQERPDKSWTFSAGAN